MTLEPVWTKQKMQRAQEEWARMNLMGLIKQIKQIK